MKQTTMVERAKFAYLKIQHGGDRHIQFWKMSIFMDGMITFEPKLVDTYASLPFEDDINMN